MVNKELQYELAEMQGQLFCLSAKKGLDSENFISSFMKSNVAAKLDDDYDRLQWSGEHYVMECLSEECDLKKAESEEDEEMLYWCGYVYRMWHFISGKSSRKIYRIANARKMMQSFPGYHTLSVELTIEKLEAL